VEPSAFLAAVRARWWLPILGLVAGGLLGLAYSLAQTPLYATTIQFFVSSTDSRTTYDALQGGLFTRERVASYAQLVTSEELAMRVDRELGLAMSSADYSSHVSAEAVSETVVINVAVTDESPEESARIAEAIVKQFPSLVAELESPADGPSPVRITPVDLPDVPQAPISPQTTLNTGLGLAVGLLIGVALAVLWRLWVRPVPLPRAEEDGRVGAAPDYHDHVNSQSPSGGGAHHQQTP
jgi:receptor protein-tyrosine kinase